MPYNRQLKMCMNVYETIYIPKYAFPLDEMEKTHYKIESSRLIQPINHDLGMCMNVYEVSYIPKSAFTPSVPPWIATAKKELGVTEVPGPKVNPRIMEYYKAAKWDSGGDDSETDKSPWCGAFIAWVMKQHGYQPPSLAISSGSWKSFGTPIKEPIIGAIGYKKRKGGGHVAFILGKDKTGTKYYMLGGNQDKGTKVSIAKFDANIWEKWVVPPGFNTEGYTLPLYTGDGIVEGDDAA